MIPILLILFQCIIWYPTFVRIYYAFLYFYYYLDAFYLSLFPFLPSPLTPCFSILHPAFPIFQGLFIPKRKNTWVAWTGHISHLLPHQAWKTIIVCAHTYSRRTAEHRISWLSFPHRWVPASCPRYLTCCTHLLLLASCFLLLARSFNLEPGTRGIRRLMPCCRCQSLTGTGATCVYRLGMGRGCSKIAMVGRWGKSRLVAAWIRTRLGKTGRFKICIRNTYSLITTDARTCQHVTTYSWSSHLSHLRMYVCM